MSNYHDAKAAQAVIDRSVMQIADLAVRPNGQGYIALKRDRPDGRGDGVVLSECQAIELAQQLPAWMGLPNQWYADVKAFHEKFGHPVAASPHLPDRDVVEFRTDLITEEYNELRRALDVGDLVKVADGCIDLIYVTLGLLLVCGIQPDALWNEVQRSNMAKQPNGADKPIKGEGWKSPDLESLIEAQRRAA